MKNYLLCQTFLFTLCTNFLFSQDFDTQLEKLAEGLSQRISSKGKTKVAVWGFFTENGERTALGNYLTEDFSVYITNFGDNFEVIDRNHLDVLLKEHQLNAEGYIDENTAKELGKIVAVDAIITGTYSVLNTNIKVRAKALDTETALQFAANMGNLPLNENIASYLGVSVNGGNSTNRGFNTPLSSNETINNPDTVDPACKKNRTGDFCFSNSSNEK
ncbi:MAG: FlgO family outer membrane protein, partial [Bacteroidota bacterium]